MAGPAWPAPAERLHLAPRPGSPAASHTVFVAPSPDAASEPWGRFKVTTDGALPPANYIVRYNSTGGVSEGQPLPAAAAAAASATDV